MVNFPVAVPLVATMILSFPTFVAQEVSITGWGGNDVVVSHKLINEVVKEELEEAAITIKYQAVESDFTAFIFNALSAGTAPDAFYLDVLVASPLVKSGKLLSNDDEFQKITQQMQPHINAAFTFNGKQYGLPKDFNTLSIVYNKNIFDDAGVTYPNNDDTWQDLKDKLKRVKSELGDEVAGLCIFPGYERFAPFALSTGWEPFNKEGKTILDENFHRAFTFYTSLKSEGIGVLTSDQGQNWGGGCFGTEKAAIAIEGNWISGYLRDQTPNLIYGASKMPRDAQTGQRGNLVFTVSWAINKDSKKLAATKKTVEILTSEKAQNWVLASGLALPSRTSLANNEWFKKSNQENQLAKTVYDGVSDGNVMPYSFNEHGSVWIRPIDEALNAVLLGQSSVDDALKIAQEKYDRMLGK